MRSTRHVWSLALALALSSSLGCSDTAERGDSGTTPPPPAPIDMGRAPPPLLSPPPPTPRDLGPDLASPDLGTADLGSPDLGRPTCDPGFEDCGGECVHIDSDPRHCGGCGHTCGAGCLCAIGACVTACGSGQTACPSAESDCGICVDLRTDPNNCGACGNVVPMGALCVDGVATAPPGTQICDGRIVSINDSNNCGACGVVCVSPCPTCMFDVGTLQTHCIGDCPGGQRCVEEAVPPPACTGFCASTNDDDANCGSCGFACPLGTHCQRGVCAASEG